MKIFIVLAVSMVACASASRLRYGPGPLSAASTGSSKQFRSEDNYGSYQFGYDEAHSSGSTSRREEQSNGVRRGSYSLSDADGRRRTVHYIADASGFRATIHTNEPGVEPKDPADVLINKEQQAVVDAAPVYAAPAPAPIAARSYSGPRAAALPEDQISAPVYAEPPNYGSLAPVYGGPSPIVSAPAYDEAPTPRAFSYSFGSTHETPISAPAPVYAASAPVYRQQALRY